MGKDRFEDLDFIDFNDSRRQEGTVIADMLSAVYRNCLLYTSPSPRDCS